MKVKRGDLVVSLNAQRVDSKKTFHQALYSILKNNQNFTMTIKRAKKNYLISYERLNYKNKRSSLKVSIKEIPSTTNSLKLISKKKAIASNKTLLQDQAPNSTPIQNKNLNSKTQSLVPEKFKPYMQRAYISRSNSFVYSQPNFDSAHMYPLSIGKQVLISKKVFVPPHNFGSFYKIFLFGKQKLVGYVSQAEVISEFSKKNNKLVINPNYKTAKKYKLENKVLKITEIEDININENKSQENKNNSTWSGQKKSKGKTLKNKFIGLSSGMFFTRGFNNYNFTTLLLENAFIGLKFSGFKFFQPSVNIDINLSSTLNWKLFYLDILGSYPFLKSNRYSVFLMGGLSGNIQLNQFYLMDYNSLDYGATGALSALIPLNQTFLLRLEGRSHYQVRHRFLLFSFLVSLQALF